MKIQIFCSRTGGETRKGGRLQLMDKLVDKEDSQNLVTRQIYPKKRSSLLGQGNACFQEDSVSVSGVGTSHRLCRRKQIWQE